MKKSLIKALPAVAAFVLMGASALFGAAAVPEIPNDGSTTLYRHGRLNVGLPEDTQIKIEEMLNARSMPDVKELTFSPESPKANEPVAVTANIFTYPRVKGDDTDTVSIVYSTDGGKTWAQADMDPDKENTKLWKGEIPGQPSGTDVIFGLKAVNYSGNMYVEAACSLQGTPAKDESYLKNECVVSGDSQQCKAGLPIGCMFPMSINRVDPDEDNRSIPDDLDITDARVGYDDDNFFIDVIVKGKVSPGTMSPMNTHIYVAGGINPDKPGGSDQGVESIIMQGAVMTYIPVNAGAPCMIYFLRGMDEIMRDVYSGGCAANDNHLIYSIKRAVTQPNPSKKLELMAFDLIQTSIFPNVIPLYDYTHVTRVKFDSRGYKVQ